MNSHDSKTRSILIAALGGEGGGVLSDWIISAVRSAGYLVQGTSIPGVAQRTGATTYYIEYLPVPASELSGRHPVFALTPVPGRVDVMIASELLEAARAAQGGYITPNRTTLIASTHRVLTTAEKIAMLDGRFDSDPLLKAIHALAKRVLAFDMQKAALDAKTVINAVILGTLAGSNALGIDPVHFENAIKDSGKSVSASLEGYRFGFDAAQGSLPRNAEIAASVPARIPLNEFPLETQFIVSNGYDRCLDFHNRKYAELFLERVRSILTVDRAAGGAERSWKLTNEGARYLALRMTYEDVMRVADLKTRASRFQTIRSETKAAGTEPVHITDFLKPGPEEICALLPPSMGNAFLRFLKARGLEHRFHVGLHIKSHTISGFLLMRLLARMRFLRRSSWRFAQEESATIRWLTATKEAAKIDYDFALQVAESADLIKGYSGTYRRGLRNFNLLFSEIVEPALKEKISAAKTLREAMAAANSDPESDALDRFLSASKHSTAKAA
ncbi:MAG: indolepyruvate oxidoreductase subunit beta family protein [Rhizobiales bacterium]|nr:indolepyruvate oxidoreductase subunit beta family protein [Hyphomicrobiales bacterium]